MSDIRVYTLTEVMAILQLTRRTLYRYIKNGDITAVKIGRSWRIREEDLVEFSKTGTKRHAKTED